MLILLYFLALMAGITAFVQYEKNPQAFITGALGIVTAFPLEVLSFDMVKENWSSMLTYTVVYLLIGILVWAPVRWYLYLKRKKQELKDESGYSAELLLESTSVGRNKANITSWMLFWALDFSWQGLRYPVILVKDAIYNLFHGIYEKMRNHVLKDFLTAK